MDIKEFAQKFIEAEEDAVQRGDFDALEQIESPDIVIHYPPAPDFNGFEAHKQYIQYMVDTSTDLTQEWGYVIGDGNVAVVSSKQKLTCRVENPIFKIPAGTTVDTDMLCVLRRENDRVAEIWARSSMTTK